MSAMSFGSGSTFFLNFFSASCWPHGNNGGHALICATRRTQWRRFKGKRGLTAAASCFAVKLKNGRYASVLPPQRRLSTCPPHTQTPPQHPLLTCGCVCVSICVCTCACMRDRTCPSNKHQCRCPLSVCPMQNFCECVPSSSQLKHRWSDSETARETPAKVRPRPPAACRRSLRRLNVTT